MVQRCGVCSFLAFAIVVNTNFRHLKLRPSQGTVANFIFYLFATLGWASILLQSYNVAAFYCVLDVTNTLVCELNQNHVSSHDFLLSCWLLLKNYCKSLPTQKDQPLISWLPSNGRNHTVMAWNVGSMSYRPGRKSKYVT